MSVPGSWIERLEGFDRRWIFLAMAVAIILPFWFPIDLPAVPGPMVKDNYREVDALPDGACTVLVSVDLDPASSPELEPYFRATVAHLKRQRCKIVFLTTWYQAPPMVERWIRESVEGIRFEGDVAYRRNEDYVWLGFREGKQAVIVSLGEDIWRTYSGRAADGTPLADIPLMRGFRRLSDFPLIVLVSSGFPGTKEWMQTVQQQHALRIVSAVTAVSTTDLSPYYQSGQLLGLAGGMSGSAEYERMVFGRSTGLGAVGLNVLNIGHLVVILAIVFGNVIWFAGRPRRGRRR